MHKAARLAGLTVSVALVLAACGGSGSAPTQGIPAPPPSGGDPTQPPTDGGGTPPPPSTPPVDGPPAPPIDTSSAAPILFVAQVPLTGNQTDFGTLAATFGSHQSKADGNAPRGGDLMIAYPPTSANGSWELRNLTREAGYGMKNGVPDTNPCGANMVAVRQPTVNWEATEALVSMVMGCDEGARWQVYKVANLEKSKTGQATFTKVAGQPANYNNVSPVYSSHASERYFFTSDMPRGGPGAEFAHLKHLDEYEHEPSVSGVWELNPHPTPALKLMHHAPSGAFHLHVDSFGRVVFTHWDHLDSDQLEEDGNPKLWNYATEASNSPRARLTAANPLIDSVFPEFRFNGVGGMNNHVFKMFLPWMVNQDGTGVETLNHVGRDQFFAYAEASRVGKDNADLKLSNLESAIGDNSFLQTRMEGIHYLREHPTQAGTYYGAIVPDFGTYGAGALMSVLGGPTVRPTKMKLSFLTDPEGYGIKDKGTGYRSPLFTADGQLWAAVTTTRFQAGTKSSSEAYDYRLRRLVKSGAYYVPAANGELTSGLTRVLGSKTVKMWEWDAVEVRRRDKPTPATMDPVALDSPEGKVFADAGVSLDEFQTFMRKYDLALIVSRNLTWRNSEDKLQPYALRVGGSSVLTTVPPKPGVTPPRVLDIDHLQIFSAQQLRGNDSNEGRRVLAQPLEPVLLPLPNGKDVNLPAPAGLPKGSIPISKVDGSMAALVPAKRALTWQTIDSANLGTPKLRTDGVVRERVWLSFEKGEVRVCVACHGGSSEDTAQNGKQLKELVNPPDALKQLLLHYKNNLRTP